jgi:hypothetical protein
MRGYPVGTIAAAAALVAAGLFMLLLNFGALSAYEPLAQYIAAAALAAGGIGFFIAFAAAPANWWRLIPAWMLLAIGVMVFLTTFPAVGGIVIAAVLFAGLAVAFAHIYLLNRIVNWWAVIPGGFLAVLGLVIVLSGAIARIETLGALLFVGLGLVFFLVYLLGERRRQWWALMPAGVLGFFGVFVLTTGADAPSAGLLRWWPLLVVLAGLIVGWMGLRRRTPPALEVNRAPAARPAPAAPAAPAAPSPAPGRAALGEYTAPAPGATVEVLPPPDEK